MDGERIRNPNIRIRSVEYMISNQILQDTIDGLKNIIKKVRNLENISTGLLAFLVYRTNMVVYNRFKALKI